MELQWYPGHMTKAVRSMQEDLKLIDLVIEIRDARLPFSSSNPEIAKLANGKLRLILLNKADLADKGITKEWISHYESQGIYAVALDARDKASVRMVNATLDKVCEAKRERDLKRGIKNRPIRAMVCGIPNVGKSTFINCFAGKAVANTGNKPGVTKGKQWIRLNKAVELLDTPGILWPKFEDVEVGHNLAFVGSINDNIIETGELCFELVKKLLLVKPGALSQRYGVDEDNEPVKIIEAVADSRHFLKKGNEPDFDKAASVIIDEFRKGLLGQISLEVVSDER